MKPSFGPGDTFLGGGEVHGKHHLWIIINDPARHAGFALFVNATTFTEGLERICVLQMGHESRVGQAMHTVGKVTIGSVLAMKTKLTSPQL